MAALQTNVIENAISQNTEPHELIIDDDNNTNLAISEESRPLCNTTTTNDTFINNDHPNHDSNLEETVEPPSKCIATANNKNDDTDHDQTRRNSIFSTAQKTKSISTDIMNGLVWKLV